MLAFVLIGVHAYCFKGHCSHNIFLCLMELSCINDAAHVRGLKIGRLLADECDPSDRPGRPTTSHDSRELKQGSDSGSIIVCSRTVEDGVVMDAYNDNFISP